MSSGPDYKRIYGVTLLPSRIHCITAGSGHLDCIRRHQPQLKRYGDRELGVLLVVLCIDR